MLQALPETSTKPNLGALNPTYPNGTPPAPGQPGASFIYPWLSCDITIHGVDSIKLPPAPGYTSPDYMPQIFVSDDGK